MYGNECILEGVQGIPQLAFSASTHKAKLVEKLVWLVSITMPKSLMNDIKTGSIELEDQTIDLEELDQAYEEDLDKEQLQQTDQSEEVANATA